MENKRSRNNKAISISISSNVIDLAKGKETYGKLGTDPNEIHFVTFEDRVDEGMSLQSKAKRGQSGTVDVFSKTLNRVIDNHRSG